MNLKKQKAIASIIATSIVAPMAVNISYADENNIEYKIVTASALNVRSGEGTSYSKVGLLLRGTQVEVISESGGWSKINYNNGKIGYVSSQYLENKSQNSNDNTLDITVKSIKVVTASALNVRSGEGTSYSRIGSLLNESEVEVISESGGWSKINYNNGKIGYVSSQYLKDKSQTTTEVETAVKSASDITEKSTKIVTASALNLRSGAGTSYSKIGSLLIGTQVEVISESGGWSKINYNGKTGYVSSQYLGDKSATTATSTQKVDKVIAFAKTLLGKKYVWGAEGPNTFDCSGFIQYVLNKSVGVSIPRVSRDQAKHGQYVNKSDLQKGDIVAFDTSGANNGAVSHVGIYIGNGEMIHASSSAGKVIISKITSGYYSNAYVNARRVL